MKQGGRAPFKKARDSPFPQEDSQSLELAPARRRKGAHKTNSLERCVSPACVFVRLLAAQWLRADEHLA